MAFIVCRIFAVICWIAAVACLVCIPLAWWDGAQVAAIQFSLPAFIFAACGWVLWYVFAWEVR